MSVSKEDIEMDGLTADERAALQDMHDNPDDTTATQGDLEPETAAAAELEAETTAAKGKPDEPAPKTENGADDGAAAAADTAAAAAEPAADAKPAAAAAAEPEAAPSAAPQPAPILVAQAPADAEAKLAEIASKRAELRKQYDDGEITFDQYDSQKDVLAKDERAIERAIDKAQIANDLTEQQRRNEWDSQCSTFLAAHAEYDGGKGERFDHLNETLKAIAVMPRNQGLTGPQLLEKAHKLVLAELNEAPAPAAAPAAAAKPAAKPAAPAPNLPPNLAHIPAASGTETGESRYAALDRLQSANYAAYEEALAKMTPAEQDAYLQSA